MPRPQITASHFGAHLRCPHRIYRDAFDDPAEKDLPNEFVQMLREHGTQYEAEIIEARGGGALSSDQLLSGVDLLKVAREIRGKRRIAACIFRGYGKTGRVCRLIS